MVIKKDVKKICSCSWDLNSIIKIVSIVFILSLTVMVLTFWVKSIGSRGGETDQNVVVVSGHGEIAAKPDTTKFTISASGSAKDTKTSQDIVNKKINTAIAALKQAGVQEKNIKTMQLDTYPKYSSRTAPCAVPTAAPLGVKTTKVGAGVSANAISVPPSVGCVNQTSEIVGYDTRQSLEVKITDISKNVGLAEKAIDVIGKSGVETSGLTSYIDNSDALKDVVRKQAISKAREQAESIAKALGVKLGKITSFSENSNGSIYPMMAVKATMSMGGDAEGVAIPVGENKISSDVNISYSIR